MTKAQSTPTAEHKYGLQEYLSLGYIYLIMLGIVGDVIYYKFLGINILNYSSISDVLMAPINTLVYDVRVFLLVVVLIGLGYLFYVRILRFFHLKRQKQTQAEDETAEKHPALKGDKKVELIFVFLSLMFVGLKIGSGSAIKKQIERGSIVMNYTILFNDNTSKQVKIIGQNSGYLFYVQQAQKEVSITPISGNIKEIKTMK